MREADGAEHKQVFAPRLETARLILRAHRLEDFDSYAALWADPEVTKHMGDGKPKSKEEAWTSFLRQVGHWQMLGFGGWLVCEKSTGKSVGQIGYNDRRRERSSDLDGVPELGWMFSPSASGKGYATGSLAGVLEWGKRELGQVRVIAITALENFASMRVAQKCGFREFLRGLSLGRERVFFDRVL